jgi:hypothetical protein
MQRLAMKLVVVFAVVQALVGNAFCQSVEKVFEHREMTWFGYFNQTRFTNKSGVWADIHVRLNDSFVRETHAYLGRLAYIFHINDRTRLSAGLAFQLQPGHNGAPDQFEPRPWQQIQWFEKKKWFTMMQWIRLEQRFRKTEGHDEYAFSTHRARYNVAFTIPILDKEVKPGLPFLFVNNEVFINLGKNVINNYFDQNRFFVGAGYQFTSHLNAQLGYMNVFQQLPAGNRYVKTDAVRLFVFHSIDLRNQNH